MSKHLIESVDDRVSPMWLPQMDAEFDYVKNQLNKDGINFRIIQVKPKELVPLKNTVKKSKVDYFDQLIEQEKEIDPIYISMDNKVLDGSSRLYSFMKNEAIDTVDCVQLMLDYKDAARVLNKIQDKYEFQKNFDPSKDDLLTFGEIGGNDEDSDSTKNETDELNFDDVKYNPTTLKLYKSKPINVKAKTGDFLLLNKKPRFNFEYVIKFDNLLEVDEIDLAQFPNPPECLAQKWFPEMDFKTEAARQALTYEVFISRTVNRAGLSKGFDGIKYGSDIVQILNP